ncbi:DUF5324 family protein [Streptomyces sp. SID3343]|uniref:DUF5324 family protein n=1 Tax=Streptomyces sp. SID3343 TaxID=2690260 RepID=UPI001F375DBA|nr:DUF5324 family protein [Streptomyces sp. SID3343]
MDPVREATGKTRERLAPHAAQAKDAAYHYAGAARDRAVETTRDRVVPALVQAKDSATPRVEHAVEVARQRVRHDVVPRVQYAVDQAREAAEPVRDEARSRAGAALSAIRGELSAADVAKITRRKQRKARRRKVLVIAVVAGAGYAAWAWWQQREAQPEWLTDEPDTTPQDKAGSSPAGLEREIKPAEDEFRSTAPGRSPNND